MFYTSDPEATDTSFVDRTGRRILVGDIVQLRLSLNSKHGGANRYRVVAGNKKFFYVPEHDQDAKNSFQMNNENVKIATVVDHVVVTD